MERPRTRSQSGRPAAPPAPAAEPIPTAGAEPIPAPAARPGPGGDPRTREARLIVLLGALSTFAPLSIDMYLPALPAMGRDLGGAAWMVQLTITACLAGLAAGQLVAGPLSDTLGRRRPLLAGLGCYVAASALCVFAPSVPVLIGLRLLQGASGAAGIVIARAAARDLYSGTALARFFSLMLVVNGVAPIAAPVIGAQLLQFSSWRGVFVILTLIGAALLAAAGLGFPETLPAGRRAAGSLGGTAAIFARLLSDRAFLGCALAGGLGYAAMFAYIAGSPFVIENRFGVSPQVFSAIFACNAAGIMVLGQLSGRAVQRFGARALLTAGLCVSAAGGTLLVAAVAAGLGLAGILPALFLVVAAIGFISPNVSALALADHPRAAGSASGLIGLFQFVIGGAAAPLAGIAGSSAAWPMAATIAVAALAAGACFAALAGGRRRAAGRIGSRAAGM